VGADLLKRLVADADVVIENYTPRVMGNFGLGYDVLREIKPDLIMMSMPGFGGSGAWNDYVAFGLSTEQMAGISHLTGYEDGQPLFTGTNGGDHLVGVMAAGAILSALHHRDRTGEGQHIDLGQVAVSSMYIGDALTGWALNGRDPGRVGNRHRAMAPHGIYACRDAGWIAIACRDAEEWTALAHLIGKPEWAEPDAPYLEFAARCRDADLIDAAISAWTEPQPHIELMHRLQAQGITAGAVLNGPQLLADPHLASRGGFIAQDRPGLGIKHYPNQPYRFARAAAIEQPSRSPLLGEHSREVLGSLLGLSESELDQLERDDVIGTLPIAARPD
jgi:benzylsuccinate CoA-transferase BbsF subunit